MKGGGRKGHNATCTLGTPPAARRRVLDRSEPGQGRSPGGPAAAASGSTGAMSTFGYDGAASGPREVCRSEFGTGEIFKWR
jgi:hypothetical protein